jgi:hypothetical protein
VPKAEEEFRQAKMNKDTVALEGLVADEYYGINQWGAKRDFQAEALVLTDVTVRVSGDHAIIDGTMTESSRRDAVHMHLLAGFRTPRQ